LKLFIKLAIGVLCCTQLCAQGPPIITDKPIMLSEHTVLIKTLTSIANTSDGTYSKIPLMLHYLPSSNTIFGVHIPMVMAAENTSQPGTYFGNFEIFGKYQFFRRDGHRKTTRMAIKALGGFKSNINGPDSDLITKESQAEIQYIIGRETIRYGLGFNVGYRYTGPDYTDKIVIKFDYGKPIMPVKYPPKQLNLYFEWKTEIPIQEGKMSNYVIPGIQYAHKTLTFDFAYMYLVGKNNQENGGHINSMWHLGTRLAF